MSRVRNKSGSRESGLHWNQHQPLLWQWNGSLCGPARQINRPLQMVIRRNIGSECLDADSLEKTVKMRGNHTW